MCRYSQILHAAAAKVAPIALAARAESGKTEAAITRTMAISSIANGMRSSWPRKHAGQIPAKVRCQTA